MPVDNDTSIAVEVVEIADDAGDSKDDRGLVSGNTFLSHLESRCDRAVGPLFPSSLR